MRTWVKTVDGLETMRAPPLETRERTVLPEAVRTPLAVRVWEPMICAGERFAVIIEEPRVVTASSGEVDVLRGQESGCG